MAEQLLFKISPKDNVAVALEAIPCGTVCSLDGQEITVRSEIPFGHKVALADLAEGQNVIKYGYPIGHATAPVAKGEHIHSHNLKTNLDGFLEYTYEPDPDALKAFDARREATFEGYVRSDGSVGIRNEIWVIPTVGCVGKTAEILAKRASAEFGDMTDGIYSYTHPMGCSQLSEDQVRTMRLIAGLIHNPNAAGVLVVSLGCENNNLDVFKPYLGDYDPDRVKFLITQDVDDEYEAGMALLKELAENAASQKRQTVSASHLKIGFKCGGSDAFSGITANPLVGRINDIVVRCGGSTVLTEVPEMFGAEQILMHRAVTKEVFEDVVGLINNFKSYYIRYGQEIYENPSPGNKKGGITTLEEKSLGCTQKGGLAPVVGVLDYGEKLTKNGLNLLIGPGNDEISCTSMAASGVQMILFTTGRGNPFGSLVPTVKVSSNSGLAARKPHWIDYNAGRILENSSLDEIGEDFFRYILDVASGRIKTNNEIYDYREISLFRDGVVL